MSPIRARPAPGRAGGLGDELYTNKRHELIALAAQAVEQIGEDELEAFASGTTHTHED